GGKATDLIIHVLTGARLRGADENQLLRSRQVTLVGRMIFRTGQVILIATDGDRSAFGSDLAGRRVALECPFQLDSETKIFPRVAEERVERRRRRHLRNSPIARSRASTRRSASSTPNGIGGRILTTL